MFWINRVGCAAVTVEVEGLTEGVVSGEVQVLNTLQQSESGLQVFENIACAGGSCLQKDSVWSWICMHHFPVHHIPQEVGSWNLLCPVNVGRLCVTDQCGRGFPISKEHWEAGRWMKSNWWIIEELDFNNTWQIFFHDCLLHGLLANWLSSGRSIVTWHKVSHLLFSRAQLLIYDWKEIQQGSSGIFGGLSSFSPSKLRILKPIPALVSPLLKGSNGC